MTTECTAANLLYSEMTVYTTLNGIPTFGTRNLLYSEMAVYTIRKGGGDNKHVRHQGVEGRHTFHGDESSGPVRQRQERPQDVGSRCTWRTLQGSRRQRQG